MARARSQRGLPDAWPGFVDALSTLLMVIIFLLVVFVLAQFFLSRLLEGQSAAVTQLRDSVAGLTQELDLERETASDLRQSLARLMAQLRSVTAERDDVQAALATAEGDRNRAEDQLAQLGVEQALLRQALEEARRQQGEGEDRVRDLEAEAASLRAALEEARATFAASRDTLEVKLAELVQLGRDIEALKQVRRDLEAQVAAQAAQLRAVNDEKAALGASLGAVRDRSAALEARLAEAEARTALAQKEIESRDLRLEDLLRDAATAQERLTREEAARAEAQAQAEDLARAMDDLAAELAELNRKLALQEDEIAARSEAVEAKDARIAELTQRLDVALADKVVELSQARSDFFGKLRRVLGEREDVRIVGDRFVFQSEVLFNTGEASIEPGGRVQLAALAQTFQDIVAEIPDDLPWVLQVDGHTDRLPINTPRFPSNWELSAARAISVARFFIEQGLAPERVAARAFGEFQPLDPADTPQAYRRNRRIEIKLTTR